MRYCTKCGAESTDPENRFCTECGGELAQEEEETKPSIDLPSVTLEKGPMATPSSPGASGPVVPLPARPVSTRALPRLGGGWWTSVPGLVSMAVGAAVIAGATTGIYFGVRDSGNDEYWYGGSGDGSYYEGGYSTGSGDGSGSGYSETQTATWETAGQSVSGVPIEVLDAGAGDWSVLVLGGMQGDSYSSQVAQDFADYVDSNPSVVPQGTRLRVMTDVNPDAHTAWSRANANGVDINRNFPTSNWAAVLNPKDPSYSKGCTGGSSPGSEPETRAIMDMLEEGFDVVIVIYSPGWRIDFDGGSSGMPIAYAMQAASGMEIGDPSSDAYISGSIGRYVPEAYGKWVISLGNDGKNLTYTARTAILAALKRPSGM